MDTDDDTREAMIENESHLRTCMEFERNEGNAVNSHQERSMLFGESAAVTIYRGAKCVSGQVDIVALTSCIDGEEDETVQYQVFTYAPTSVADAWSYMICIDGSIRTYEFVKGTLEYKTGTEAQDRFLEQHKLMRNYYTATMTGVFAAGETTIAAAQASEYIMEYEHLKTNTAAPYPTRMLMDIATARPGHEHPPYWVNALVCLWNIAKN
jgi:hypothetical protein